MALRAAFLLLAATQSVSPFGGWQVVGSRGVSAGPAICCDVATDPHGVVHVAYQDQILPVDPATVQEFIGGAWRPVGVAGGASIRQAWYDHLAFDGDGEPILACRDYGVGGKLNVRSFTTPSNTRSEVGQAGAHTLGCRYNNAPAGHDAISSSLVAHMATSAAGTA